MFKPILVALSLLPLLAAATARDVVQTPRIRELSPAHVRQGADLSRYKRILIRPVTVEFSEDWHPKDFGVFGLKSARIEEIRSGVVTLTSEVFGRVLTKDDFSPATEAGADVLDMEIAITDLYVNAPEDQLNSRSNAYVRSTGYLRINLTLRDSLTGEEILRTSDLKHGEESDRLVWATDNYNRVETERILSISAKQLQKALRSLRKP